VNEALLDTDILSYYFRGDLKVAEKTNEYLSTFNQINISIITYYEIIGGLKFKKAQKQLNEFEEFIINNNIIHISEKSARISGDIYAWLRSKGIIIGTSDILIAGVAIDNDLTLITNNIKHYALIPKLKMGNWK